MNASPSASCTGHGAGRSCGSRSRARKQQDECTVEQRRAEQRGLEVTTLAEADNEREVQRHRRLRDTRTVGDNLLPSSCRGIGRGAPIQAAVRVEGPGISAGIDSDIGRPAVAGRLNLTPA